jgi:hypothetical protein
MISAQESANHVVACGARGQKGDEHGRRMHCRRRRGGQRHRRHLRRESSPSFSIKVKKRRTLVPKYVKGETHCREM